MDRRMLCTKLNQRVSLPGRARIPAAREPYSRLTFQERGESINKGDLILQQERYHRD